VNLQAAISRAESWAIAVIVGRLADVVMANTLPSQKAHIKQWLSSHSSSTSQ